MINMFIADNSPGRTVIVDGKEFLFFSGTAYLGISKNESFHSLLKDGISRYGSNFSSSRKNNFRLKIFEEAETALARFVNAPSCITVSSGYMAGQIVVRALEGKGEFFYAPATHPALWRRAEDFSSGDFKGWSERIADEVSKSRENEIIILANSIDALLSIEYKFDWVKDLPDNKNIILIVDDSHGLGLIGREGRGVYEMIPDKSNVTKIVTGSIGKAMGLPGGAIFSSAEFIQKVLSGPWFGTSSPMNPAYLYAYLKGQEIFSSALIKLKSNVELLRKLIGGLNNFNSIPGYPVFYFNDQLLSEKLLKHNIIISSFPYPLPEDDIASRIVLNSHHTQDDIRFLAEKLKG